MSSSARAFCNRAGSRVPQPRRRGPRAEPVMVSELPQWSQTRVSVPGWKRECPPAGIAGELVDLGGGGGFRSWRSGGRTRPVCKTYGKVYWRAYGTRCQPRSRGQRAVVRTSRPPPAASLAPRGGEGSGARASVAGTDQSSNRARGRPRPPLCRAGGCRFPPPAAGTGAWRRLRCRLGHQRGAGEDAVEPDSSMMSSLTLSEPMVGTRASCGASRSPPSNAPVRCPMAAPRV